MDRISLFNKLIGLIDQHNIPYALVGRTEGYPENIGSDVDIVIPRDCIADFHKMIWNIEDKDTKIIQMFQHEIVAFFYIVFHFDGNTRLFIQPDVCTDYYRKGRLLLTADYLLYGKRNAEQGGFYVLAPEKEFLYYLLKKVDKRSLSAEQFEHIRHSFMQNQKAAMSEATHFWSDDDLKIIKTSMENNDYKMLGHNLAKLQDGIHSSHRKQYLDIIKNVHLKINRILKPTGFTIAIMGPDGSGKTTVMNQFKKDIEPAFRRIQQFHLYPVPQTGGEIVNTDPHGKTKRAFILSVLKLCYILFIYRIGHTRLVMPKKIRSTLTIFDRYYDDILVDPVRYRNGTPDWIVKMIGWFIPKPELWFFLDCPTEVIQARKSEVTPEETERQRHAYLKLASTKKNSLVLNTNRKVEDISIDACRFICELLNKRAKKRYK